MGRARKPLEMQKGNLTVKQQQDIKMSGEVVTVGNEQLLTPPDWLINETAEKEYLRIVLEFEKIDMVGNLDLNNIACYCNAYANYREATKEMKGKPLVIEKQLPNGSYTLIENPLIKIQKNYADEMRKFGAKCGMDIDSRLKAGTIKVTRESQEIDEEFGGI